MTIHSGGKFPSNPRGTPQDAGESARPRRAAEKRQERQARMEQGPANPMVPPRPERPSERDRFETAPRSSSTNPTLTAPGAAPAATQGAATTTSPGVRVDELMTNPSQIRQMAEAITAHARRLGGEFDGLRGTAQDVVGRLAQGGFSPDAVSASREELGQIRTQMAGLRGKIAADHRRLKLLKVAAHRLGETRLSEKITTQLKKVSEMERGWGRAFLALGIAGTFGHAGPEGDARPARVMVAGAEKQERHALGSYLGAHAPGTAASQLMVALLEEGPLAPSGRLVAEAYAELHADILAGRFGKSLQGLGLWRQAMG